jgi:hypothetical protein
LPLIELAFELGKTLDELDECDARSINRMLIYRQARINAASVKR